MPHDPYAEFSTSACVQPRLSDLLAHCVTRHQHTIVRSRFCDGTDWAVRDNLRARIGGFSADGLESLSESGIRALRVFALRCAHRAAAAYAERNDGNSHGLREALAVAEKYLGGEATSVELEAAIADSGNNYRYACSAAASARAQTDKAIEQIARGLTRAWPELDCLAATEATATANLAASAAVGVALCATCATGGAAVVALAAEVFTYAAYSLLTATELTGSADDLASAHVGAKQALFDLLPGAEEARADAARRMSVLRDRRRVLAA